MNAYRTALLDWLACAYGGRGERAAMSARSAGDGLLERVAWLGTAGHVLDFDDTYLPGIAHLSAPTAPAAVVLGASLGRTVGEVVEAYAAGFEAMGRLSRAHRLYDGGWHPTAVCGSAGAAVVAARLLGVDEEQARRLALLRAAGLRAAFGSDGKSLQVGMAAAAGVHAALIAGGGAVITADVVGHPDGFAAAFGPAIGADGPPAIDDNWIKPWPCCLMSHSAVQAASEARPVLASSRAPIEVAVHPVARRAAAYDDVADGLQAKFSIPYLVGFVVLHGEPRPESFDGRPDPEARALARERVRLAVDPSLGQAEAVVAVDGEEVARVPASRGSPQAPLSADELAAKCRMLAGPRLDGLLDDPDAPAQALLDALA